MKINRSGSVVWTGGLKDGKGAITTQSGALTDYPMAFPAVSKVSRGPTLKN